MTRLHSQGHIQSGLAVSAVLDGQMKGTHNTCHREGIEKRVDEGRNEGMEIRPDLSRTRGCTGMGCLLSRAVNSELMAKILEQKQVFFLKLGIRKKG